MQTNQTPEALIRMARDWQAIATREAAESLGTPEGAARLVEAKRYGLLADALRDMAASGAKDAERWNEALRHVGGARDLDGIERFSLRTIRPLGDVTIYRGSVAEHFTKAIDAATKRGGA